MKKGGFVDDKLVILTKYTLDYFLSTEYPAELTALYTFYYYTAKWQETNQPRCTTAYVANGLKWSEAKVQKFKKMLLECGLVEDIAVRDEGGKITGHYIKLNYIFKVKEENHPHDFPEGGSDKWVDNSTPNALSVNNINALSVNSINAYPPTPLRNVGGHSVSGYENAQSLVKDKFSAELEAEVLKWFKYKTERKDKVTPTGLETLINKIDRMARKYGSSAVVTIIEDTISAGYQGIVWEWLEKNKSSAETVRQQDRELI